MFSKIYRHPEDSPETCGPRLRPRRQTPSGAGAEVWCRYPRWPCLRCTRTEESWWGKGTDTKLRVDAWLQPPAVHLLDTNSGSRAPSLAAKLLSYSWNGGTSPNSHFSDKETEPRNRKRHDRNQQLSPCRNFPVRRCPKVLVKEPPRAKGEDPRVF